MFSSTHMLIAHSIYKVILSKLKIKLNYSSFRYGSIAPDLYPSMMFVPHSKNESISIVNSCIRSIRSGNFTDQGREVQRLSFELGIIVHFLCDYFCTAHNEEKYNNMLYHYIYERRLKKFFEKNIVKYGFKESGRWEITGTLNEFINKKYEEYKMVKRSMTADAVYSLSVSTAVAVYIVSECSVNYELNEQCRVVELFHAS